MSDIQNISSPQTIAGRWFRVFNLSILIDNSTKIVIWRCIMKHSYDHASAMKKKMFMVLDILLLLLYSFPLIFPHILKTYVNDFIVFFAFLILLVYYGIRSKISQEPFMNISRKNALVRVVVYVCLVVIDLILSRFGDYPHLLTFEIMVSIIAGELYRTLFEKKWSLDPVIHLNYGYYRLVLRKSSDKFAWLENKYNHTSIEE